MDPSYRRRPSADPNLRVREKCTAAECVLSPLLPAPALDYSVAACAISGWTDSVFDRPTVGWERRSFCRPTLGYALVVGFNAEARLSFIGHDRTLRFDPPAAAEHPRTLVPLLATQGLTRPIG